MNILDATLQVTGVEPFLVSGLSWTLRAAVLLGLAWIATRLLRESSAAIRHGIWVAAFLGALGLPLTGTVLPWQWEVASLPVAGNGGPDATPASLAEGTAVVPEAQSHRTEVGAPVRIERPERPDRAATASGTASVSSGGSTSSPNVRPGWILLLLWGAGTAAVLAVTIRDRMRLGRIRRDASALAGGERHRRIHALIERAGLEDEVAVLESEAISVPLTSGVLRRDILLPASAREWNDELLDNVLLHELAHVRRRDVLTRLLARLVCAAQWFNPLSWVAARHMARESERACDDRVLRTGTRPSTYAQHLLEIVRGSRPGEQFSAAVAMARKNDFEGRILALLDPDAPREPLHGSVLVGTAAVVLAIVVLVSLPAAGTASDSAATVPPPAVPQVGAVDGTASAPGPTARPSTEANVVETLVELLHDPHPPVREAAARSLGERAAPDALPHLTERLADPDDEVREEAAVALGRIGDPAAVGALARALVEDPREDVRKAAAWALGETESAPAVDRLAEALEQTRDDHVRKEIVEALGETRRPEAVAVLEGLLDQDDRRLQRRVLEALVAVESGEALDVLIRATRSDDRHLRRSATLALGGG